MTQTPVSSSILHKWNQVSRFIIYISLSSLAIVLVGVMLRSGFQYIGDGALFVFRDGLFSFLVALIGIYILSLIVSITSIRLPYFDYVGRIVVINLLVYSLFGFTLSLFQIPLYSRTLIVSEFILSTLLVLSYFFLRNRLSPTRIGVLSEQTPNLSGGAQFIKWITVDTTRKPLPLIDGIVVNLHETIEPETQRFLADLGQQGISVYDRKHTETLLTGRLQLDQLSLGEFDNFNPLGLYGPIKRILDITITLLISPMLVTLGLLIALTILIFSRGPIFFTQERVGYLGSTFVMLKFRSMRSEETNSISRFATKNDERITQIGSILRRTRLDELPQFWNVLKGDMSIVGPRPEQSSFAKRFAETIPFYGFRQTVRPGITGWAQVKLGYTADENQTRLKLEYDFFYIKYLSLWLEIIILVRTIGTIILGKGAR